VSAEVLLGVLDDLSARFTDAGGRLSVDKNRTIGNAYLAAIGLTDPVAEHTIKASRKALELVEAVDRFNDHSRYQLKLRIGLDIGAEVCNVASRRKVTYDL
jgi:class 3 adenylate cyclase